MANLSIKHDVFSAPRTELHETLGLTGCEASVNILPAGAAVPFIHSHKKNEELYVVISGEGKLYLDGEITPIKAGDAFRIAPEGKRCIAAVTELKFICVQAETGSLSGYTMTDAAIEEGKAF